MEHNKRKNSYEIFILVMLLLVLICIISFAVWQITAYSKSMINLGENLAKSTTLDYTSELDTSLGLAMLRTSDLASSLSPLDTEDKILDRLRTALAADSGISLLRFFLSGIEHDSAGYIIEADGEAAGPKNEHLIRLISSRTPGCAGIIYDSRSTEVYIAFYCPVEDNEHLDGIVTYFSADGLLSRMLMKTARMSSDSEYLAVCSSDGTVVLKINEKKASLPADNLTNFYERLQAITGNKADADLIRLAISNDGIGSTTFYSGDHRYTLAAAASASSENTLFIVNIYDAKTMIADGYSFLNVLVVTLLIFLLTVICSLIYVVKMRINTLEKVKAMDNINPLLECNTFKKFSLDTDEILRKNKISKFALVYTEIEQFHFITASYENLNTEDILRFVAKVYKMSMRQDETYGHIIDDHFVLLIHYSDEADLMRRLRLIHAIVFNYPEMKKLRSNLRLSIGAYCIDRTKDEPIQKLIDRAIIAQKTIPHYSSESINIYSESVQNIYVQRAIIESRKDVALKNNEFQIFYQPKYNIAQNRTDGSEALVRWYDPENGIYRNTAEFVPIFEADGFVSKLDRYVYVEVCKYISEAVARGDRVVPVSINVSRVTATQDDFVSFYISTKKKYNIADDFLTIEFTESFAIENYDVLKDVIKRLKANGIRCSIDDFGAGYSSYSILKELPMDELKLDRFFISNGLSKERDDLLLKSIIKLAKDLGMKVTQEGVEDIQTLRRLEDLGCDVIQGYYYSRPLELTEYTAFLNNESSRKITSSSLAGQRN